MAATVSVITPLYNSSRFIEGTLDSLLEQTYRDWECVLVDDGSTDETHEKVAPYLADRRFGYVRQANQGIAAARNVGVRTAAGTWIALLDHDDRWTSTKLERQLEFARLHECTIVGTDGTIVQGSVRYPFSDWIAPDLREQVEHSFEPDVDTFGLLIRVNFLCASSVLFRRSVAERHGGFDSTVVPADDYDLWLRCMPQARIGFVPERLVEYVLHGSNFSADSVLLRKKAIQALLRTSRRHAAEPLRVRQCEDAIRMHHDLLVGDLWDGRRYRELLSYALRLSTTQPRALRLFVPSLRASVPRGRAGTQ